MISSADGAPGGRPRTLGLYVHVPFCASLCSYCHFVRTADSNPAVRARYVDDLLRELRLRSENCAILRDRSRPLDSAYFGGGTPSLLEPDLATRLLQGTMGTFACAAGFEATLEANPESLDEARIDAWQAAGIGRISLGVQSLRPGVLQLLGRAASPARSREALRLACRRFARVSADWILGPALRTDRLQDELAEAIDLGVEHFSLYILEVHAGTTLERRIAAGQVRLPADAETERLYLAAGEYLESRGIFQYEVANFARPGAESRHNRAYWSGRPYLGLGPGAHSFWGRRRSANESDPARWSARIAAGEMPEAEVDPLDRAARRLERVILALRTARGVPLAWLPAGALDLERGRAEGWWRMAGGRLVLTRPGFLRLDGFEEALAARIGP